MKLKDIGEFGFIDRIKHDCVIRDKDVIRGIGDDCCVFHTSRNTATLLTTDMLVEGVHFLLPTIPPHQLGRKSLAVNLSDIAAMGGTPKEAIISIAIPDTISLADLDALYAGMKSMAKEFMVNLLGGDTTSSPERLVISIAVVGEAVEDEILFRSGARAGQVIFLTGPVGSSAAGLDIILKAREVRGWSELIDAHNDPYPAVKAGRIIAKSKLASALIDVSDGVAADLGHVCAESNVGAILESKAIPNTEQFRRYCETFSEEPTHMSLHMGEDYVLLGTVPAEAAKDLRESLESNGCQFYPIGHTVKETGLQLKAEDGSLKMIDTRGWNHFK